MRPFVLLPAPLLTLALAGCLPELPEEKANEGNAAGDCSDDADNDDDGAFDCDDDGCAGSDACTTPAGPPESLEVAVTPETPVDDDDLSCVVVTEAVDPNGDAVTYTFAWTVDGEDAGLDLATLPAGVTSPGQTWTCTVTPSDGTLTGTPASATVTIQRENAAPSAPAVAITPEAPNDDNALTCAVVGESVDPDGDAVTYAFAWTVDGVDAGVSGASVDPSRTSEGETWTCSVTASDGTAVSGAGSASVSIAAAPVCGDGSVTLTASGVDFVSVCAQTFEMGCTPGAAFCGSDEALHTVTLTRDVYLGRTEVTRAQFQAVMGYLPAASACGDDCAVDHVPWQVGAAYANAVSTLHGLESCYRCSGSGINVDCAPAMDPYLCEGYRLPTEAEWEAAARCGTTTTYAGSDTIDEVAWYASNAGGTVHPVAQKLPNDCGLYDMSGNLWELVQDWEAPYPAGPVVDPTGPASGEFFIVRGGGWGFGADGARVHTRGHVESGVGVANEHQGLRLARTVR
jgi:formylglycine-generating enzyme required for sulfatase activity